MDTKSEQPLAFACAAENGHQPGMLLRDYFAAAYISGTMAHPNNFQKAGVTAEAFETHVAKHAYRMADALLKART